MALLNTDSNIPNKVIACGVSTITPHAYWPYDDGTNDPYWNGGSNRVPYQWLLTVNINPQTHSSHLTREPYEYNGLDVWVGDWISNVGSATPVEIIAVQSKTETQMTIIVEDRDRYNTYRDSTQQGVGIFSVGNAVIFSLNEEGLPLIDPLPALVTQVNFASQLTGRFRRYDMESKRRFEQENHTFEKGDIVGLNSDGEFQEYNNVDTDVKPVGTVANSGPKPNFFYVAPFTKFVANYNRPVPGNPGDYLYRDVTDPEFLGTDENGGPLYIKIANATPSYINGTVTNPTVSAGNVLNINDVDITMSGTSLSSVINDINNASIDGLTASSITSQTRAESNISDTAFGIVGGGPPFAATINGVTVNFSTTASGGSFANENDIVSDINAAEIPNLIASSEASKVVLTETTGAAITIVNVTNDTYGNPFAGPTSVTGLPLSTPASTDSNIRIEQANGFEITVNDTTGTVTTDLGITTAWNGQVAVMSVVEDGLRQGKTYVVADLTARDALSPIVGDMSYVLDTGEGEWAAYIYNGSEWAKLADFDSANTDSTTASVEMQIADTSAFIYRVSPGSKVNFVTVEVLVAFDDPLASLSVGDSDSIARLLENSDIDLTSTGIYQTTPSYIYDGPDETEIYAYLNAESASTGSVKISISYN